MIVDASAENVLYLSKTTPSTQTGCQVWSYSSSTQTVSPKVLQKLMKISEWTFCTVGWDSSSLGLVYSFMESQAEVKVKTSIDL